MNGLLERSLVFQWWSLCQSLFFLYVYERNLLVICLPEDNDLQRIKIEVKARGF